MRSSKTGAKRTSTNLFEKRTSETEMSTTETTWQGIIIVSPGTVVTKKQQQQINQMARYNPSMMITQQDIEPRGIFSGSGF